MKTLTPTEIEQKPFCEHDFFEKCYDKTQWERGSELHPCWFCKLDGIGSALTREDFAGAMHQLDIFINILKAEGYLQRRGPMPEAQRT